MTDTAGSNSELIGETSTFLKPEIRELEQSESERKQAEEALRRAEENFRRSLDESPLGVRIVTAEGETIYANRAMLDIHGYDTIAVLKETPVKERYTPESYSEFQIRREKRRQGIEVPLEYDVDIIRKNGEVRHLQVFRKTILWDGERQFQVIYNDISDRKRAEAAVQKRLKELNCLYGISALAELPGIPLDEILQRTVTLIPLAWQFPEIAEVCIRLEKQTFRTGRFRETPWMLAREIMVNGKPAGQVEVCYLEERRTTGQGPFMIEEGHLLNAIAEHLGRIIERMRAEEKLAAESRQVEEANTALRVLLQRVKEDQQEIERRIMANIQKLVLPGLERLRGLKLNDLQADCLDIVTDNIQQVTSPFLQNLATCFADFTPREVQVANMIKEGMTSKEIACIFNISIRTVDFYRDIIRKKLGLNHKKANLRTFLMQLSEK